MSTGGMPHRVARAVGQQGEDLACAHIEGRGWELLDRNWRCTWGEIDIVARHGDVLVFCEVKTRRSQRFGSPVEAVTPAKAARLRRLAGRWLREHGASASLVRVDVIGVLLPAGGPADLVHLEGVA
jgi:putative endonuclease